MTFYIPSDFTMHCLSPMLSWINYVTASRKLCKCKYLHAHWRGNKAFSALFHVSVEYLQDALAINYSETTAQRRRPLNLVILLSTDNVSQHTSALKVCFCDQHGECMLLIQNEVLVVLSLSGVPLS